jgi:hypothetical protein
VIEPLTNSIIDFFIAMEEKVLYRDRFDQGDERQFSEPVGLFAVPRILRTRSTTIAEVTWVMQA